LTSSNYTAVSGAIDGDTVVLTQPSGTYDNKNVGTGKAVSVTGIALSTATSSTGKTVYGYTTTTTASGNIGAITKKDITAEGIAANSKVYDATTAATLNNDSARLNGVCTGDVVNLTTVSGGVFSDKNAGTGKTVTISGLVITGADSGNYTLTNADPYTTTADITPRQITVTADNKTKEFGAPDPPFTYTVGGSGFAGSETKADVFTGGLTRIPGEAPNKYDILQGTLTPNSNYAISLYTKGQLTINPMPVTPTINQVQMTQNSYNVLSTDSVGAGAASYGEGEKDSSGVPGDLKYVNTDSSTPAGRGSFILFVVNGGVNESL
jgi:hypothetical protein